MIHNNLHLPLIWFAKLTSHLVLFLFVEVGFGHKVHYFAIKERKKWSIYPMMSYLTFHHTFNGNFNS